MFFVFLKTNYILNDIFHLMILPCFARLVITSSTSIPSANLCCSRFCLSSSNYLTWCPPHNITWLLRICNVFSNFISLLWNYAAQHNSTWLQTSWNTKGLQLLGICMPAFICIRKLQELCWLADPSIRASVSIHSLTKHNFGERGAENLWALSQTTEADP